MKPWLIHHPVEYLSVVKPSGHYYLSSGKSFCRQQALRLTSSASVAYQGVLTMEPPPPCAACAKWEICLIFLHCPRRGLQNNYSGHSLSVFLLSAFAREFYAIDPLHPFSISTFKIYTSNLKRKEQALWPQHWGGWGWKLVRSRPVWLHSKIFSHKIK